MLLISGMRSQHCPSQWEAANKLIRIMGNWADKSLKPFANRSWVDVEPFPQPGMHLHDPSGPSPAAPAMPCVGKGLQVLPWR